MVILGLLNHHPTVKQNTTALTSLSSSSPPHPQILPLHLRSQIKCKRLITRHSEVENFSMENPKYVFPGAIMKCWEGGWRKI